MLLLTYLWNASPSVCEDTRQDLPSQLPPRCTGFAVHWELGSTEVPGTRAPQAVHSIPHTFPTPSMQGPGPGEADMNQTRSLPTEGPQSAGGGNTHINYTDPGWLGTSAGIQVQRQARLEGGKKGSYFSIRVSVKNEAKDGAPGCFSARKGSAGSLVSLPPCWPPAHYLSPSPILSPA